CEVVAYGLEEGDYTANNIEFLPTGIAFDIKTNEGLRGRLSVPLYGRHNVLNSLASVAGASGEGLGFDQIKKAAAGFKGTYRRFNILTAPEDPIAVIDDYAHHPTEVKTTLEAAKLHFPERWLVAVFRPHTYSRTKALLNEYQTVFSQADKVYITDVEGAREAAHKRIVSGADIVAGLDSNAVFEPDRAKLVESIAAGARPGDVILCMTVSGYDAIAQELAKRLNTM
ncbi:MAG: glutamate ligase domain-containing protein, partial [Candidatus Binatia bacterium]